MTPRDGIRLLIFTLGLVAMMGCGSISAGAPGAAAQPSIQGDSLAIMGAADPQKLIENHVVQDGEHISVGPGGGATLTFPDASTIFFQAGAETIITLQQSQPSVVNLLKGTVRAQGAAKSFTLQTPDAKLTPSASDTIFTVYNTASQKSVEVTSGVVELHGADRIPMRITAGNNAILTNQPVVAPTAALEATVAPTVAPTSVPTTALEATAAPTTALESTTAPTTAPEATVAPTLPPDVPVVATQAPAASAAPGATTNDEGVSMRSGPNTNTTIIVSLQKGTPVSVIREQSDWTQVRLVDGREGWIFSRYLTR